MNLLSHLGRPGHAVTTALLHPLGSITTPSCIAVRFAMATHIHPSDNPLESLSGTVERVTFHSEATGFCVLRVKARGHRDLVTVVGTAAVITPGEFVSCEGWWVTDRTYGLQFKTASLQVVPPTSLEGIEKYLGLGSQRHWPALCQKARSRLW